MTLWHVRWYDFHMTTNKALQLPDFLNDNERAFYAQFIWSDWLDLSKQVRECGHIELATKLLSASLGIGRTNLPGGR